VEGAQQGLNTPDSPAPPSFVTHGFIKYRADIDGMRAIAVLCVVIYHALPQALPGGFIGVDVFFVISGYLISGQIFSEIRDHRFSVAAFYGRRVRRIFPALILVLLTTFAYGFVILLPSELAALGADVAAGAAFISNLMLWQEAGYFDRAAMLKPLLHLWSLGVEEQFYIFWPVTLWLAHRIGLFRLRLLVALTAASFVLSVALAATHAAMDFYAPFTRLWELSTGALLAWRQPAAPRRADIISWAGLLLIIGGAVALNAQMVFPGWWAAVPVLGAVLLIGAGPQAWVNRTLLSRRAAVFIGTISYPLYLWHWPLLSYAYFINNARTLKTFPAICIIAAAFALAAASYRWVERPLRYGGDQRIKTICLTLAMAVTCGAGVAVWAARGLPARFPPLPNTDISKINLAVRDGVFAATPHMRVTMQDGITIGELGDSGSAIMLTGDSMLFQWDARVEELLVEGKLRHRVYFVSGPSCRPFPGIAYAPAFTYCYNLPKVQARIIRQEHIRTIIIGARWPDTLDGALGSGVAAEVSGWVRQGLGVYVILPVPRGTRFDPALMVRHGLTGFTVDRAMFSDVPLAGLPAYNAPIAGQLAAIAQQTGAGTLDPRPDVCGAGPVCSPFFGDGEPKFADENHLRPVFVRGNVVFLDGLLTR
jgi:peptidoglycan/LPS O-acetylase OafA/YrhL